MNYALYCNVITSAFFSSIRSWQTGEASAVSWTKQAWWALSNFHSVGRSLNFTTSTEPFLKSQIHLGASWSALKGARFFSRWDYNSSAAHSSAKRSRVCGFVSSFRVSNVLDQYPIGRNVYLLCLCFMTLLTCAKQPPVLMVSLLLSLGRQKSAAPPASLNVALMPQFDFFLR